VTALTTLHKLAELPQLPIANCPTDRRNQILSTSLSPGETTSSSHLYANTSIGHLRNNSRTCTKQTELFVIPVTGVCSVFSVLLTLSSSFSYTCSYPLHFPSFSCAKIHCSASQLLFLLLLNYFLPLSSPLPLILPQHFSPLPLPPTYLPPTDKLTIPTVHNPSHLQSLTRAPSTTRTEMYPKMHKGHKTQQLPTSSPSNPLLLHSFFSATFTNNSNFYI
jgi:hypothetical protein